MNQDNKVTSGANHSFWTDESLSPIKYTQLEENFKCDAVIIGGGIAGLSIAYELLNNNYSVAVIEDGYIGSGETGRTTAHLTNVLDERYTDLLKLYGNEKAGLIAESHIKAIDKIESIIRKEEIACDFARVDGVLFCHPSDSPETLKKEFDSCNALHLPVFLKNKIPGMKSNRQECLIFPDQAVFHPMKYLRGLCNSIISKGGKIFTTTHVKNIGTAEIITDKGYKISAANIIVATNSPINNKDIWHMKKYPYRSYVITAFIPKNSIPNMIWWDTGDSRSENEIQPYHFVRIQNYSDNLDVLICGGEDHPTGQDITNGITEEQRYQNLEMWCRKHFEIGEIINQWSGQILYSMDRLAYLGRNPADGENIFIATGDSGNGMTYANIAAEIISDQISGRSNKYEEIYSPGRFKLFQTGQVFLKETFEGFVSYFKNKSDTKQEKEIKKLNCNEGNVFEIEGTKYGVFKDAQSNLYVVNAKCTHMGCTVKWNNDEKSWDCPCHGSRFNHRGEVINGPANEPLEKF